MVTVRCLVYNHAPYIRQCLDGIVMQKTNFHFEAIVHDDASTDGSALIISQYAERYPNIIKPIYESENQYSKSDGSLSRIMNEHTKGKYIAFCEGDDFWTDPYKLQKQIDLLESNVECGLCYTKASVYNDIAKRDECYTIGVNSCSFEQLLLYNSIPTLTVVMSSALYKQYLINIIPSAKNWKMGDYPAWLYAAVSSKIVFIDETTATYRVRNGSASRPVEIGKKIGFINNTFEIQRYYAEKYGKNSLLPLIQKRNIQSMIEMYLNNKLYCLAIKCALNSPLNLGAKIYTIIRSFKRYICD